MKKIGRFILALMSLLAPLVVLVFLANTGRTTESDDHSPDLVNSVSLTAPQECVHEWVNGVCSLCGLRCNHTWQDSVCTVCAMVCAHEFKGNTCVVCGFTCLHDSHDEETAVCTLCGEQSHHHYENGFCTGCGREPLIYDEPLPEYYFSEAEHIGTYYSEYYEYNGYADRIAIWLPYDYNEDTKYNVAIMISGKDGYGENWVSSEIPISYGTLKMRTVYDHVVEEHLCAPFIVVGLNSYDSSVDSCAAAQALREGLFPYLAETYSTWAEDGSYESLVAAREHFAIGGLSLGSMYAYLIGMEHCLDIAGNYCCFSNHYDTERVVAAINSEEYKNYPITCYVATWAMYDAREYRDGHRDAFHYIVDKTERLTEGENAIGLPFWGSHNWLTWSATFVDAVQYMFSTAGH